MKISERMQSALNAQLNLEFYSAYLYMAMSSRVVDLNMNGAAQWLRAQAAEELLHAMKMVTFVESRGGSVALTGVAAPGIQWKSPIDVFEAALAHEQHMSDSYNNLVDLALKERDHATNNLLQWFVAEQVEEESTLGELIQRMRLVGSDGTGLYMLDRDLAGRAMPAAATPPAE